VLTWCVKWYYAAGDKPLGPVTRAELDALFESGAITTSTMVTQEGMYEWVPYVNLKKTTQFLPAIGRRAEQKDKSEEEPHAPSAPVEKTQE